MRKSLYDFCVENGRDSMLTQWDSGKNLPLTPHSVTYGSRQKLWWQCPEGHVWRAVIYSRTGGKRCGCPVCAGRVSSVRVERYAAMITGP